MIINGGIEIKPNINKMMSSDNLWQHDAEGNVYGKCDLLEKQSQPH